MLPRFAKDPAFTVMENPGFWGYRLRFNMEKLPEFKKEELRQAFAYAINRQDLVDKIARGAAIPGSMGILSPHRRWYNPHLSPYDHNPEKAMGILAGLATGPRMSYELLVGGDREVRIGEILKEQLDRVGIKLRVVSVNMKARDARMGKSKMYRL